MFDYQEMYELIGYDIEEDLYDEGIKDTVKKAKDSFDGALDSEPVKKFTSSYNKSANKRADKFAVKTTKRPDDKVKPGQFATNDMYDEYAKKLNKKRAAYRTGELAVPFVAAGVIPGLGGAQIVAFGAAAIRQMEKSDDPQDQAIAKEMKEVSEKIKNFAKETKNMGKEKVDKMSRSLILQYKKVEKKYNARKRQLSSNKSGLKLNKPVTESMEDALVKLYTPTVTFESVMEIIETADFDDESEIKVAEFYINKFNELNDIS